MARVTFDPIALKVQVRCVAAPMLSLNLGGQLVTVLDASVYTGVTLGADSRTMLVSHDLFVVMEEEVRNGQAKEAR